jgi:hypothetical protein
MLVEHNVIVISSSSSSCDPCMIVINEMCAKAEKSSLQIYIMPYLFCHEMKVDALLRILD